MAVQQKTMGANRAGEETPLLRDGDAGSQGVSVGSEESLDDDKARQYVGRGRALVIILSLWALIFLQASNMSALTTTQSRIAEDLDAFSEVTWFTSSYLIALASLSPIAARLAQIFSPRACISASSFVFGIGGIVTSQAQSLETFLLGRIISGIAAAGIMTISFILVLELSGRKRRGLFIGLVNTGFTMGVSLGAVIAGALLHTTGWRFFFWIQTPFALFAGLGLYFGIPSTFTSGQKDVGDASIWSKLAGIDYLGAATLIGSLATFLFGLSGPKIIWIPIIISACLLVTFVLTELYIAKDPIIPVTVLKSRATLLSCFGQLGLMSARWMVLFYTPAYALAIRGWSPASAGSILIPTNLGFATGGILVGMLHINRGGSFWLPALTAMFLFSCSLVLISQILKPGIPAVWFLAAVFANGCFTGASLNYVMAHLLHLTPPSTHYISTALLNTFRGFAGSFGSAIGGGLFLRVLKSGLEKGFKENGGLEGRENLVRRLLGSPPLVQMLRGVEKKVAVDSYVASISTLYLSGAVVALFVVFLQAGTGWKVAVIAEEDTVAEENVEEDWEEGMDRGA